jgi:beta-lactamase class D
MKLASWFLGAWRSASDAWMLDPEGNRLLLLDERSDELRGCNWSRAEQGSSPASTFRIANTLIGLSVGAVGDVDQLIPCTGDPNPWNGSPGS